MSKPLQSAVCGLATICKEQSGSEPWATDCSARKKAGQAVGSRLPRCCHILAGMHLAIGLLLLAAAHGSPLLQDATAKAGR